MAQLLPMEEPLKSCSLITYPRGQKDRKGLPVFRSRPGSSCPWRTLTTSDTVCLWPELFYPGP